MSNTTKSAPRIARIGGDRNRGNSHRVAASGRTAGPRGGSSYSMPQSPETDWTRASKLLRRSSDVSTWSLAKSCGWPRPLFFRIRTSASTSRRRQTLSADRLQCRSGHRVAGRTGPAVRHREPLDDVANHPTLTRVIQSRRPGISMTRQVSHVL